MTTVPKRSNATFIIWVLFLSKAAASTAQRDGSPDDRNDLWEASTSAVPTRSSSPTTTARPSLSPHSSSTPSLSPSLVPSLSPSKAPVASTPAPTPKATTATPTPPPTPPPSPPPTAPPTPEPDDDEPKRISVFRFIERTIAIFILLVLSLLVFGAIMKNRYRIYFFLRGVWYTILSMECTGWIMQKLGISSSGYQPVDAGLSTVIFENEMDEGLLMRETDT